MTHLLKMSRQKIYAALAVGAAFILALVLILTNSGGINLFAGRATGSDYTLTLDNSNAVSASGDVVQHTKRGSNVTFTYTNVSSCSGGHTRLAANGKLVNKDQITSITDFTITYSSASQLQFRTSYDGATWGQANDTISGYKYELGSKPYYIEFSANGSTVDILSIEYSFSCQANPDAAGETIVDSISWDRVSNESQLKAGDEIVFVGQGSGSDYHSLSSSIYKDYYLYPESITLTNSGANATVTSSNTIWTLSGSSGAWRLVSDDNKILYIYSNDSGSHVNVSAGTTSDIQEKAESSQDWSISISSNIASVTAQYGTSTRYLEYYSKYSEFTVYSSAPSNSHYIYKKVVSSHEDYNVPVDVVGFEASNNYSGNYTTNSVFDNENTLVVKAVYSDGSKVTLNSSEYSFIVRNENGDIINTSQPFGVEGVYTLVVSYGNFIPQEINLIVGEYIYIVDITASTTKTSYTTADALNSFANLIKANVTLSNSSNITDISYSEFATYGIGMKLVNVGGISYDITKPFGTAGTWYIRVFAIGDEDTHYDISITVAAIPVETISLDTTSKAMYVGDSLQLNASIYPSNATNTDLLWESNDLSVATVNADGATATVTAVGVGGTTITATSQDGTAVYGTCSVTVSEKPAEPETLVIKKSSFTNAAASYAWYNWTESTSDNTSISGKGEIYHNTNTSESGYTYMQFNKNKGNKVAAIFNTTAIPGSITKIEAKTGAGTNRAWNAYVASTAYSASGSTLTAGSNYTKINSSAVTIETSATEIGTSSAGYSYFCIQENDTSASFIDEFIITYETTPSTPITPIYPTAITVTGDKNSISIGETAQLSVGYTPSDTNVKNVTFSTSNSAIATVSNTGLVTGIAQGSATITVTAESSSGTVSNTFNITVTPIAVTSVSLSENSISVKESKTYTLSATVYPSNATNKAVTWLSSDTSVATVNNSGVVTGVSAGTATITVKTSDGNKTASCTVTVTSSSGEETFSITYTDLPSAYSTTDTVYTAASGIKFQAYNCAGGYSSKMQFRASSGYIQTTEDLALQSITINDRESNTLTVYGSNTAGSFSTEITGTNDVYDLTGYSYFKVARTASGAGYCSSITVVTGTPTPTDPTSIIMSPTSAEVGVGGTKQLSISYVPSNANQNKQLTWTSSNTNVATVSSDGLVSVKSTASAGQTATITARLTNITSIYATCTITVTEQTKDDHTVLIYICGADLESKNSLATGDIQEILKVSGQPDDVNIVIETGGANSWASTYGISSTKLERWHVENKSLVKDASLNYASMGLTSTLQSFIEYGLNNYPAERTGLVLWNHGGGMHGVCYDEKKSDDSLLDNEVKSAVSGALSNCGMSGQKLEWIGYDACLMAVQDIAEMNSTYFNYMIASEESEAGYGWDYDNWVDDLYAKKTTPVILKAICDSFISDNGGVNSSSGDQTLSYMDLSKASAYKTAWEAMASQLQSKLTSSNKSTFNNAIINNVKHFADSDYDYFCLFDAKDFINKLASNSAFSSFRIDSSYTTAVINAHANFVPYSTAQKGAGNAFGLCMYWCNNSSYSDMSVYTTSHTNFTTWRSINNTYGTHN